MAIGTTTPRDKLDQLFAFLRRALRYWWLVATITLVGGAVAALLAFLANPKYVSEARLVYNERIDSSVLQGRNAIVQTQNLGNRYREMLMARRQLAKVVEQFKLYPEIVAKEGLDAAIDELQEVIDFRMRGSGVFHIKVVSAEPELSQGIAEMLTTLLIQEDLRLRRENASATRNFLLEEKAKVNEELRKRMKALAGFLAEHPEFAQDSLQGPQAATGAGVRAAAKSSEDDKIPNADTMDPRLLALERQRRRLRSRLAAPDDRGGKAVETPEMREARQRVREAERELEQAERRLSDLLERRLKSAHPDVVRARAAVEDAKKRVTRAEAAVPPAPPPPPPINRDELRDDLKQVERQIASTKDKIRQEQGGGPGQDGQADQDDRAEQAEPGAQAEPGEEPENWVVALETEFARLTQEVEEARRRSTKLDASLSEAEITASQQMAEEGAVLAIIDPANLPSRPEGKGPIFLTAAGIFVFGVLGCALALGLALVNDRIYTAGDLEQLGIAPVMVVIPRPSSRRSPGRSPRRSPGQAPGRSPGQAPGQSPAPSTERRSRG